MPASLSPEGRLNTGLIEIGCNASTFAKISGVLKKTRLLDGLNGKKEFTREQAAELWRVLIDMILLQNEAGVPIAWERIRSRREVQNTWIRLFVARRNHEKEEK